MSRWLSLAILLAIIVVVAVVFYRVMAGFVLPLFLAAILVIMFRPLHQWCQARWPKRPRLAAMLTVVAVVLLVVLPTVLLTLMAAVETSSLVALLRERSLNVRLNAVREKLDLEYPHVDEIRYLESSLETLRLDAERGASAYGGPAVHRRLVEAVGQLDQQLPEAKRGWATWTPMLREFEALRALGEDANALGSLAYQSQLRKSVESLRKFKLELLGGEIRAWFKELANPTADEVSVLTGRFFAGAPGFLRSIGGATTGYLATLTMQCVIMILSLYFFFKDGGQIVETIMRLSPLEEAQERELITEFDRVSRAVVLATILSAVIQGLLAGIGFWMFGVGMVFLLSMITVLFALIPFVGAASVWMPACLWLYFSEGRPWAALMLAAYGAIVVSTSDNIVKPLVLHGQSNLHPLLALLSVLGGVRALGPVGIFVGPIVVVLLQTLLNILHREIMSLDGLTNNSSGSTLKTMTATT